MSLLDTPDLKAKTPRLFVALRDSLTAMIAAPLSDTRLFVVPGMDTEFVRSSPSPAPSLDKAALVGWNVFRAMASVARTFVSAFAVPLIIFTPKPEPTAILTFVKIVEA